MALGSTQPVLKLPRLEIWKPQPNGTIRVNLSLSTVCLTFVPNKKSRRLYNSIGARGEQIRGDRSSWRSHFVR